MRRHCPKLPDPGSSIVIAAFLCLFPGNGCSSGSEAKAPWASGEATRKTVTTTDSTNRILEFFYLIPQRTNTSAPMPVLLLVPALDGSGREFVGGQWKEFAEKNGFVVVSPTFRFNSGDWNRRKSYQFPEVWSGRAVIDIIDTLANTVPLNKKALYCFGHSAGAQFVHRFALLFPDRCRAVAFHAPGGITLPDEPIEVKFLLTVGREDPERAAKAKSFVDVCGEFGIPIEFKEYPGVGHELCPEALLKSMDFFAEVKQGSEPVAYPLPGKRRK